MGKTWNLCSALEIRFEIEENKVLRKFYVMTKYVFFYCTLTTEALMRIDGCA